MRNLLTDADRDRLVAPLAEKLAGDVTLGGRPFHALAAAEGSGLFPLTGNARAVDVLLLPGLRERHGALGDFVLDFVMALAEADPPSRRAIAGGIEVRREDPRDFEVVTALFRFTGNLARGIVRQEPRGPGGPVVLHTGNLVEFAIGFRKSCADAEDPIDEFALERHDDRVVLRHAGPIEGEAGLLARHRTQAGRLEIAYEIRTDSPVLRLTVRFTAARALSGVRLTTALDAVAEGGLGADAGRLLEGGTWRDVAAPAAPGAARWANATPVTHLAVGRAGWPADAAVLHLRPADPARVMSITAQAQHGGAVHWLLLRHGPSDLAAGETLEIREDRLLAEAGETAAVAAAMASGTTGLDLDPAPPSGAALQAVATALLLDGSGAWTETLAPARRAALASFAVRQAARVEQVAAEEELGHALIGADALRRAGEPWAAALQSRLATRLAALLAEGPAPTLAGQALAVLGLARAAVWPDGQAAALALGAAVAAVHPAPAAGRPGLALAGRRVDPAIELTGVAILARAAGAVVLAEEAGAPITAPTVERAVALNRAAIALLRPQVRPVGNTLRVGAPGGMAPGPQALVALALLAPDRYAFDSMAPERTAA